MKHVFIVAEIGCNQILIIKKIQLVIIIQKPKNCYLDLKVI